MRAAVQDGQLANVMGASRGLPLEKPDLVVRLIMDFLSDEQTVKFVPGPTRPRTSAEARAAGAGAPDVAGDLSR